MTTQKTRLDADFLSAQRGRLARLRNEILSASRSEESERTATNAQAAGEAHEYEEDAQRLTALELQENLAEADVARLVRLDRALQKIEEGTYGLSDASGAAIALERLQATPEAIYTLDEQAALDRRA